MKKYLILILAIALVCSILTFSLGDTTSTDIAVVSFNSPSSISFTINPNGADIIPEITLSNNGNTRLRVYIKEFIAMNNGARSFNYVNAEYYTQFEWDTLSSTMSDSYMSLSLSPEDESEWSNVTQGIVVLSLIHI